MNAYFEAMQRYADFSGRSSRSQFWLYTLVYFSIFLFALVLDGVLRIIPQGTPLAWLWHAAHLLPGLAITIRRLHDVDRSGWWFLLSFTIIGAVVVMIWMVMASKPGPNRFGPQPGTEPDDLPLTRTTPRTEPDLAQRASLAPQTRTAAVDLDRLEKLAALKASGVIDDDEFARMKADVINAATGRTA